MGQGLGEVLALRSGPWVLRFSSHATGPQVGVFLLRVWLANIAQVLQDVTVLQVPGRSQGSQVGLANYSRLCTQIFMLELSQDCLNQINIIVLLYFTSFSFIFI